MLQGEKPPYLEGDTRVKYSKATHPSREVPERSGLDSGVLPGKSIKVSGALVQLHTSITAPTYGMFSPRRVESHSMLSEVGVVTPPQSLAEQGPQTASPRQVRDGIDA
jgi:hypothetical protein